MKNHPQLKRSQQGAVLFVCLMLLILLTLIAVTSSKGSALQERMAGNLRSASLAFESAESMHPPEKVLLDAYIAQRGLRGAGVADSKRSAAAEPWAPALTGVVSDEFLDVGDTVTPGVDGHSADAVSFVRRYDRIRGDSAIETGRAVQDDLVIYQITGIAGVSIGGDRAAPAVSQELYIP
jgi:PilX N-terminal